MFDLPSIPCYFPLLPSPTLRANFVYNFFEINELAEGSEATQFAWNESNERIGDFSRYVALDWNIDDLDSTVNIKTDSQLTLDKINLGIEPNYLALNLQDLNVANKIEFKLSGSLERFNEDVLIDDQSPLNVSELLALPDSKLESLTSQTFYTQINKNILRSLFTTMEFDAASQYSGSLSGIIPSYLQGSFGKTVIETKTIKGGLVLTNLLKKSTKTLVGFLIDKYEIDEMGNIAHISKELLKDGNLSRWDNFKVTYGRQYAYTVRAVYFVEFNALGQKFGEISKISTYIASPPSNFATIICVEDVPPPHPIEQNFEWIREVEQLKITWNLPVNPQRDIKGFLILKRHSLNEPFQMIRMFDFNDAVPRIPLPDYLNDPVLVKTKYDEDGKIDGRPVLSFVDKTFTRSRSAIYALVSYDAHGLYSNLSPQFEVRLDQQFNKIKKRLISQSGAPLEYPNLYLEQDLFLDTLVVDNFDRLKVNLDPSAYQIKNGNSDTYLTTKYDKKTGLGKYVFTFLNVAQQEQENYEFRIQVKSN